jgi:hypothetical protein
VCLILCCVIGIVFYIVEIEVVESELLFLL